MHILSRTFLMIPGDIEKASIDEAFLDLTEIVRMKILERCPYLRTLPAGTSLSDPIPLPPLIEWKDLGLLEVPSIPDDEARLPDLGNIRSEQSAAWQAYAFALAAEIMLECRTQVKQQLGYTCSAGIAGNKVSVDHPEPPCEQENLTIVAGSSWPRYAVGTKSQTVR
jgi:DNA polymerase eta